MAFDSELYLLLMAVVCQSVRHDTISADWDTGECASSLEALAALIRAEEPSEMQPPANVVLTLNSQPRAIMETEFWVFHGGPHPYHDSYTFSIYASSEECLNVERKFSSAARAEKILVRVEDADIRPA